MHQMQNIVELYIIQRGKDWFPMVENSFDCKEMRRNIPKRIIIHDGHGHCSCIHRNFSYSVHSTDYECLGTFFILSDRRTHKEFQQYSASWFGLFSFFFDSQSHLVKQKRTKKLFDVVVVDFLFRFIFFVLGRLHVVCVHCLHRLTPAAEQTMKWKQPHLISSLHIIRAPQTPWDFWSLFFLSLLAFFLFLHQFRFKYRG